MKRRIMLCSMLLVVLLSTLPAGAVVLAQGEGIYKDPAGLFTVPVPTNWKSEARTGYVLLTDPDSAVKVYVLAVDENDVEKGLAKAWQIVQPGFDLKVKETVTLPEAGQFKQFDQAVQTGYQTAEDRVVIALGERMKDKVYALLFDTNKDAAVRRGSQLGIISSGFQVTGQKKDDLTAVKPKPVDAAMAAELDGYIKDALARAGVPGAVVAIVQDGKVVFERSYGVKELGKPDPMLPTTQMMIGSTGKTLTTLMMATIVDAGRMTWDTPAVAILPSFAVADPALSKQITMRNLVCACTGVPRRDLELIFNAEDLDAEKIVASLKTFQFFTKFGEAFQYSNQMVGAGGYLAALAGGGDPKDLFAGYAQQLQQRVLDPIGMTHTTLSFDKVLAGNDYATPHGQTLFAQRHPIPLGEERLLLPIGPAGAHWSTASDMSRYLITLMNLGVSPDGRKVVSPENLKVLWDPQVAIDAENSYGLGWMVGRYKNLRLMQHGGNTFGFTSDLAFLPDEKLGIVILSNGQGANAFTGAVRSRILELVFGQPFDGETSFAFTLDFLKKNLAKQAPMFKKLDTSAVESYLGTFTQPVLGDVTLSLKDGKLMLDAGDFATELRMKQDEDGKVTYVTFDAPVAGLPFELKKDDSGQPILVMNWPPDSYKFVRK
jgi:CubicO group peptidase (beta-lactamase class C family)